MRDEAPANYIIGGEVNGLQRCPCKRVRLRWRREVGVSGQMGLSALTASHARQRRNILL